MCAGFNSLTGKQMEKESAAEIVMNEMIKNIKFYMNFHEELQNNFQLLQQADLWLDGKKYMIPVGDVCNAATANGLGMNLYIFEKIGKKAVTIQQRCTFQETSLFLCYTHTPNTDHIADHYDAIINSDIPFMPLSSTTSTTSSNESSQPEITEVKYTPPNITEQKYTPQSNDEVINLLGYTDDDDTDFEVVEDENKKKKYKGKCQKSYLNLGLFSEAEPEVVDHMPWAVQGNKIFPIRCSEDYWHDKQLDRYHWKFTKGSHKGLDGIRKFGTCHRYFVCKNNKCTKYTENVCNTINFQRDFKGHTGRSCGFYTH